MTTEQEQAVAAVESRHELLDMDPDSDPGNWLTYGPEADHQPHLTASLITLDGEV